jgi:hypothetical protein
MGVPPNHPILENYSIEAYGFGDFPFLETTKWFVNLRLQLCFQVSSLPPLLAFPTRENHRQTVVKYVEIQF